MERWNVLAVGNLTVSFDRLSRTTASYFRACSQTLGFNSFNGKRLAFSAPLKLAATTADRGPPNPFRIFAGGPFSRKAAKEASTCYRGRTVQRSEPSGAV